MKKWIILDAMGVIFEVGDDTNDLLVPYIMKLNNSITPEHINKLYIDASLGKITSSVFWKRLGFENIYPEVEINYLNQCLTLDTGFTIIAKKLEEKYNFAMLSNDVSNWSFYLMQKYNLNQFFQKIVISGDVGFRKPSEEIYNIVLERIGCNANDSVFIDDSYKNLVPALKLGMRGIKFKREKIVVDGYKGFEIESFVQLPSILSKVFELE